MITASCWRAITVALETGAVSRYPDLDASAHAQTFGRSHNDWRKGKDMDEMDRSQVPPCCVCNRRICLTDVPALLPLFQNECDSFISPERLTLNLKG